MSFGDQALQRALAADHADRLLELHGWLDDSVGDLLRHYVIDAHQESQWPCRRPLLQRVEQLLAQGENLVGVAVHELAHLRGNEIAPGLGQQFLAEAFLEGAQLGADGRRGQRQLLARARKAAGANHGPEVQEMLVIEAPDHGHDESPQA
jgi:hypothetical protein